VIAVGNSLLLTDRSYLALVQLACAIIAWRKVGVIYGEALSLQEARTDRTHLDKPEHFF
jgi:hypothetical protein